MRFILTSALAVAMALAANAIRHSAGPIADQYMLWSSFVVFSTIALVIALNLTADMKGPNPAKGRVSPEAGLIAAAEVWAAVAVVFVLIIGIVSMIVSLWGRFRIETYPRDDGNALTFLRWWMDYDSPTWGLIVIMAILGTAGAVLESASIWAASKPVSPPRPLTAAEKRDLWRGAWRLTPWLATAGLVGTWVVYLDDSPRVTEVTLATAFHVWLVIMAGFILIRTTTWVRQRTGNRESTATLALVHDQAESRRAA